MAYDPWDWTNSSKPMGAIPAPMAAIPIQAGNATIPNPVNTVGPLQQMVEGRMLNAGINKADDMMFGKKSAADAAAVPVSDATPVLVNPPTNAAPLATDAAAAQGAEIATTAAPAEGGFSSIASMAGK